MGRWLVLILVAYWGIAKCQEKPICDTIVFNDSLFNIKSNDFDFQEKGDKTIRWNKPVTIVSNKDVRSFVQLTDKCLNFTLSYQCNEVPVLLVSNGKVQKDAMGRAYLVLKVLVAEQQMCKSIHYDHEYWSTYGIKTNYVKFEQLDSLLLIK